MKRLTVILLAVVLGFAFLSSPSISEAQGGHGGHGAGEEDTMVDTRAATGVGIMVVIAEDIMAGDFTHYWGFVGTY